MSLLPRWVWVIYYSSLLFDQTGHIFEFSSSKLRRKHSPALATEKRMLELKQELVIVNPFPTVISRCQQVLRKRGRFCTNYVPAGSTVGWITRPALEVPIIKGPIYI